MKNGDDRKIKENRGTSRLFAVLVTVILAITVGVLVFGFRNLNFGTEVEEQNNTVISCAWWGNDGRHQYMMDGLDLFQEKNPGIIVTRQYGVWNGYTNRMDIMMRSHEEADVMLINYAWIDKYSKDGTGFYDLKTLKDVIDLDNFADEDLAFGTAGGHLNALPTAYNAPLMLYNKDLYEQYGLELPKTFDDLFAAAKVMSRDGIYPVSMVEKQCWLLLASWYEQTTGKALFSPDGKFQASEQDVENLLLFYRSLIDNKVMPILDNASNAFQSGTAAGVLCWISDSDRYAEELEAKGKDIEAAGIPQMEGAKEPGLYRKPATMYAISQITAHPEEAGKLLDFLLNDPDMALLTGTEKGIPVSKTALKTLEDNGAIDDLQLQANREMQDHADQYKTMVQAMEDQDIIDCFKENADRYLYDRADVSSVANDVLKGIQGLE